MCLTESEKIRKINLAIEAQKIKSCEEDKVLLGADFEFEKGRPIELNPTPTVITTRAIHCRKDSFRFKNTLLKKAVNMNIPE